MIHTQDQDIQIQVGAGVLSVPAKTIVAGLLERLQGAPAAAPASSPIPKVGEAWAEQGGVYAGIVRGADGDPDYHLVLADFDKAEDVKWPAAMEWARSLSHRGFADYSLPNRREQSVLFANAKEFFEAAWHWSCEQHAAFSYYAWSQVFDTGSQGSLSKDYEGRARAVRRVLIIR